MKRKLISVILPILVLIACVMLAACTQNETGGSEDDTSTVRPAATPDSTQDDTTEAETGEGTTEETTLPAVAAPLSLEEDMGISAGGTWFPIRRDAEELLNVLGDDYSYYSAPSCAFVGEDKEFTYSNAIVYTNPDGDTDLWYLIVLLDDSLQTSRGIKTGDSVDDIIGAYGESYFWDGDSVLVYSISGDQNDSESPRILFTLEDDAVSLIEIYYPTGNF